MNGNSEDFVVHLEWTDKIKELHVLLAEVSGYLPHPVTKEVSDPEGYESIKAGHIYYCTNRFMADNIEFDKLPDYERINQLLEEMHLDKRLCWGHAVDIASTYVPHRETGWNYPGSLIMPLADCTDECVTSFAHWQDPTDRPKTLYYHEFIGEDEPRLFREDEIAYSYSVTDHPILFNNEQFHQVVNSGSKHRRILSVHFRMDQGWTWEHLKEKVRTEWY